MKKIISILMIVAMLASIAVVSTSAAGQILLEDDFTGDINESNWWPGEFYIEQGWLKGYRQAVVCQSNYGEDGNKVWGNCSISVDVAFYDYDNDSKTGSAKLWWKDIVLGDDGEVGPAAKGNIYTVELHVDKREVWLNLTGDFDTEEDPLVVYKIPDEFGEIVVNEVNPTVVNIGMRVAPTLIECFLNGERVITYTPPAPIGTQDESAICLWNDGMYMGFDNFKVATVDYPLFAADTAQTPAPTDTTAAGTTAAPETSVKTEAVVVGTNDKGEDITEIVTEIVTVAPADTNTNGTAGGNGANTGDMAIIVVAVMVVALGTAIVVKKVSVK